MPERAVAGTCADPQCPEEDKNVYKVAGALIGKQTFISTDGALRYVGMFHLDCGPANTVPSVAEGG